MDTEPNNNRYPLRKFLETMGISAYHEPSHSTLKGMQELPSFFPPYSACFYIVFFFLFGYGFSRFTVLTLSMSYPMVLGTGLVLIAAAYVSLYFSFSEKKDVNRELKEIGAVFLLFLGMSFLFAHIILQVRTHRFPYTPATVLLEVLVLLLLNAFSMFLFWEKRSQAVCAIFYCLSLILLYVQGGSSLDSAFYTLSVLLTTYTFILFLFPVGNARNSAVSAYVFFFATTVCILSFFMRGERFAPFSGENFPVFKGLLFLFFLLEYHFSFLNHSKIQRTAVAAAFLFLIFIFPLPASFCLVFMLLGFLLRLSLLTFSAFAGLVLSLSLFYLFSTYSLEQKTFYAALSAFLSCGGAFLLLKKGKTS